MAEFVSIEQLNHFSRVITDEDIELVRKAFIRGGAEDLWEMVKP